MTSIDESSTDQDSTDQYSADQASSDEAAKEQNEHDGARTDEAQAEHAKDDNDTTELVRAAKQEAEEIGGAEPTLGTPGPPVNRRSPFMIGMTASAGVVVTYVLARGLQSAASILALIGLSLFLAIGLEPAVAWFTRHKVPRGPAVGIVALLVVGVLGGFLALSIPPLVQQTEAFIKELPTYVAQMRDHSTTLGKLDARFHIQQHVQDATKSVNGSSLATGLLSAGQVVLNATVSTFTVLILTVYLLFDLPRIRRLAYRLTPASRRARVILIGDEVSAKVGRYVLGNLFTSLIAGLGTFIWLFAFHVPYPIVLALMVALFDLIPIVGSTVGGIIVSLIALTVSLPVAIATAAFYLLYRLLEDYLIVPRVIGRAVHVPATVTIVSVLVGGAMLGLLGALVAIPAAAAIDVILRETVYPRLDRA